MALALIGRFPGWPGALVEMECLGPPDVDFLRNRCFLRLLHLLQHTAIVASAEHNGRTFANSLILRVVFCLELFLDYFLDYSWGYSQTITDLSDFLGRLQPSKTTIQETLNTLGVEESSSPRDVLHF